MGQRWRKLQPLAFVGAGFVFLLVISPSPVLSGDTLTKLVDQRFPDMPRYLSIDGHLEARVAPGVVLTLDCLPFALRVHSLQLNVSSLQWKFGFEEEGEVISEENPLRRVQISSDGFRLTINRTTMRSGADLGTDGLYTCRSCNADMICLSMTTNITIFAPPMIETDCSSVPVLEEPSTQFLQITVGCDLCVEVQQAVEILELLCMPTDNSRIPTNCNWQIGREPLVEVPGRLEVVFGSLIISDLANPPESSQLNFLQTYTCNCSNLDGSILVASTIGACLKPPIIRKGIPKQPFPGPEVPLVSRIFDIGSNDSVQIGFSVVIECIVLQGLPRPNITWFKDSTEIVDTKEQFILQIDVTTAEAAEGNYTCVASNRAGTDSAFTLLRSGIEIVQSPKLYRPQKRSEPEVLRTGTITESVGANVFVIIGEDVELVCNLSVAGLPPPKFIWSRNARILNISETTQYLTVVSTDLREFDLYCCEVQNIAGYDTDCSTVFPRESGPLIRVGKPMPFPVLPYRVTTAPTTVRVGGSLWTSSGGEGRVVCEVYFAKPPLESIEWFIDGLPVLFNGSTSDLLAMFDRITIMTDFDRRTSTLIIRPTQVGDDANITCRATSAARSNEATSQCGVLTPPVLVQGVLSGLPLVIDADAGPAITLGETLYIAVNQTAVVDCQISNNSGLPVGSVVFAWMYFGTPIRDGGGIGGRHGIDSNGTSSRLTIRSVKRTDTGMYYCTAESPAGYQRASAEVKVFDVPMIDRANSSVVVGPLVSVYESLQGDIGSTFLVPLGERLFLDCNIIDGGGFPTDENADLPARIEWYRDGVLVSGSELFDTDHTNNQLCFNAVNLSSGVVFECRAVSRLQREGVFLQDSATSQVTVLMAPTINQEADPPVTQVEERGLVAGALPGNHYVAMGDTVRLGCNANADPSANFTWIKMCHPGVNMSVVEISDKITLISAIAGTSELVIGNFSAGDQGSYVCNASNIAGSSAAVVNVSVCPLTPNCSGDGEFLAVFPPNKDTDDNCTFCASYDVKAFGPCHPQCSLGIRNRTVVCWIQPMGDIVDLDVCDAFSPAPERQDTCCEQLSDVPCSSLEPQWSVGEWSPCTSTCVGGYQRRRVECYLPVHHTELSRERCSHLTRPEIYQHCNVDIPCGCFDRFSACRLIDPEHCFISNVNSVCCVTCRSVHKVTST